MLQSNVKGEVRIWVSAGRIAQLNNFFVCNRENSQLKKLRDHGVATLSETGHHFVQMSLAPTYFWG